jgi:hypothetical protein
VLVSTAAAKSHHWAVGSVVPVELDKSAGAGTLRVVGTFAGKGSFGDYLLLRAIGMRRGQVGAGLAGIVAAIAPARRAARLNLLAAIAGE